MFRNVFGLLLIAAVFCLRAPLAEANPGLSYRPPGFDVSGEIQGRIDFWKLIFTKYGQDHLVFHHREHPQIIYSVLDLSDYKTNFGGKELVRATNRAVEQEISRIQTQLTRLADGAPASGPAERRLAHLFALLPGNDSANYREAAEVEKIRYQKGIKEMFREGVVRSGRYLHAMERVFEQEGLPVELTRLPLVESSFNYTAYSSVGAAGIWQFMRGTGKRYMRIDASIDERKDPIMSTRAAARYFEESYRKLGSWPLAVTSYNHGLSGVFRAKNAAGSRDLGTIIRNYDGESFGFASKNFYAEFMAALEVERRAEEFFPGIRREEAWHFDEIRLGRPISFAELVRFSGADRDELEKLNRALLSPVLKGRASIPSGLIVRVPQGRGRTLLAAIGKGEFIDTEAGAETVLARPGKRAKTATVAVAKQPPQARKKSRNQPETLAKAETSDRSVRKSYTVVPGDNPSKIAKKLGIPMRRLKSLNPKMTNKLKPGQQLVAGDS